MWDVRIKINVKEMDNTPKNRRGFQERESFPILHLGKGGCIYVADTQQRLR